MTQEIESTTASTDPVELTWRQTLLLLAGVLAAMILVLYLVYSAAAWLMGWNSAVETKTVPKPVIVSKELSFNLLSPHTVDVQVRNDGVAGRVRIELRSYTQSLEAKRSESGIEKSLRETFTTKLAPPPVKYETKYESMLEGTEDVWLEAGESKTVKVNLAVYNWADMISGKQWSASAIAIPPKAQ